MRGRKLGRDLFLNSLLSDQTLFLAHLHADFVVNSFTLNMIKLNSRKLVLIYEWFDLFLEFSLNFLRFNISSTLCKNLVKKTSFILEKFWNFRKLSHFQDLFNNRSIFMKAIIIQYKEEHYPELIHIQKEDLSINRSSTVEFTPSRIQVWAWE